METRERERERETEIAAIERKWRMVAGKNSDSSDDFNGRFYY
jgi:hypothetical protein